MRKLACLIPCFNEKENLGFLCDQIMLNNNPNIDWFIINNGSTDIKHSQFQTLVNGRINSENIFVWLVKENNGYGNGIKNCYGNIIDNYDLLCWTHADGQTPIKDVVNAYEIYLANNEYFDLIKGVRISRKDGFLSKVFTMFFNVLIFLFLNIRSRSSNSQPTLIKAKFAKLILPLTENNANFDISVLFYAKRYSLKIKRFPVSFQIRRSGIGSNESIKQKLKYSLISLKYLLKEVAK